MLALSAGTIGAVAAVTVLGLAGAFTRDTTTLRRAEPSSFRDAAGVAAAVAPAITAVVASSGGAERRGSGVAVSSHEILTTTDIVDGATTDAAVSVTTADGKRHDAEIRGRDPVTGLVLLDVPTLRAHPVQWSDTDSLRAGDWVVAIGRTPARPWVTSGVVTAVGGWMTDAAGYSYAGVITTSTELAQDARGGALVDQRGHVVGILASSASAPARTSVLPSDMAGDVATQLSERGRASHGALGVRASDATPGVAVTEVLPGSGAARAGLEPGDRITEIDGVRTADTAALVYELRRRPGGTARHPHRAPRQRQDPARCRQPRRHVRRRHRGPHGQRHLPGHPRRRVLTRGRATSVGRGRRPGARMDPMDVTDLDAELLNAVQWSFPLDATPYATLADRLGTTEEGILTELRAAKDAGVLRQLSAIFDTRALGYSSALVAAKVDPDRVDEAAAVINAHPGVSHNYKRNHAYNLWYTLAVPPGEDFAEHLDVLHRDSGATVTRPLPTLQLYKIGVKLDMTGTTAVDAKAEVLEHEKPERRPDMEAPVLTPLEVAAIRIAQEDLPLTSHPFADLAARIDTTEDELLAMLRSFADRKLMRRFAAVMNHRTAGFKANAMGVWAVPEDELGEIGPQMAGFAAVSHCYRRPTYDDWPYTVFTMVHGRTGKDCEAVIAAISSETGVDEYALLWSIKEYKKTRVRYFTPEWDEWRDAHLVGADRS